MFEKKVDPIEERKAELAQEWKLTDDPDKKKELIRQYLELDDHQLEREKVRVEHGIDGKTIFNNLVMIGLAVATLNFERFEVLRSKVVNLWLRRRQ